MGISSSNGQTSTYAYYPNSGDHRLQEIHHRKSGGVTLSKFNYSYDAVGNINTWTQQEDTNQAKAYDFEYDRVDQIRMAVWRTTDQTPTILKRYAYTYDPAGNRTVEQIDDSPVLFAYDSMNRLTSQTPGGAMRFAGTLNEAATVTIQGLSATVTADNRFEGPAQVSSGTNQVVVKAKDYAGNERTNTYEVSISGSSKTFTFDANGNMTGDGTRTLEWDAENRLIAINQGTLRSEFTYNGLHRRVRMVEKSGGVVQSERRILWCEMAICEERDADGTTVVRRAFAQGEQVSGVARFFTTDHLSSVRELTDVSNTVQARYGFDPWGRRTVASGSDATSVGFTGHRRQATGELWLTLYRGYDADLAQWISEDRLGLSGGLNLYVYVSAKATRAWDPLGLQGISGGGGGPGGGGGGGGGGGAGGGGCCCDLQKRRERLHEILNEIDAGGEPEGTVLAQTTCDQSPRGGSYNIMPWAPPCWVPCLIVHEERHLKGCRLYGPEYMAGEFAERTGYTEELGCTIQRIRKLGCE